jgi:hypothetical protein
LWALASLQRARLPLARRRRASGEGHRPIVIVAVEPVSADWFYEILVTALRRRRSNGKEPLSFHVVRLTAAQAAQRLIGNQPAPTIIVAELDRWRWQVERCDVLYLRPGLLILWDILPAIGRKAGAAGAPEIVQSLDRLLSRCPAISLETLFHEPQQAAECFNRWCSVKLLEPGDFPAAPEERYRMALSAILHLVERGAVRG